MLSFPAFQSFPMVKVAEGPRQAADSPEPQARGPWETLLLRSEARPGVNRSVKSTPSGLERFRFTTPPLPHSMFCCGASQLPEMRSSTRRNATHTFLQTSNKHTNMVQPFAGGGSGAGGMLANRKAWILSKPVASRPKSQEAKDFSQSFFSAD